MSIIDLQEISPSYWQAKYQGNYGVYTIKIETDGKEVSQFSCSCPSSGYPCKHIGMVKEAIKKQIEKTDKNATKDNDIDDLLKGISLNELRAFISRKAKYNDDFRNNFFLEFSHKINKKNSYSSILRNALCGLDYEDMYDNGYELDVIEVDVLNQWLRKAREKKNNKEYQDAIQICQACIEEYAEWLPTVDGDIVDYINEDYKYEPFQILSNIISETDVYNKELFDYCKTEIAKEKYEKTGLQGEFEEFLSKLAELINPVEFLSIQDKLFEAVYDKSSYEAKQILQRKIDFYKKEGSFDKAWEIIKDNTQIDEFRKQLISKYISENKLSEAKKLIKELFSSKEIGYKNDWEKFLLEIAQKESDIAEIRRITYLFIANRIHEHYYNIYKSTFEKEEWSMQVEKLIKHYNDDKRFFRRNIADVLVFEGQKERLVDYVKNHLSLTILEDYYIHFPFPQETIVLFRKAIDEYAANNLGRDCYEYIARLFDKMIEIDGGRQAITEMISNYKTLYKNRKAMMEILQKVVGKYRLEIVKNKTP